MGVVSTAVEVFEFGGGAFFEVFENTVEGGDTGKAGMHGNLGYGEVWIE